MTAYELLMRGRELLQRGDHHAAATVLARARALEPEKGSIREVLGRALFNAGDVEGARTEFAKALEIDPSNDFAHYALARCLDAEGISGRAAGHLKLARAMRPECRVYGSEEGRPRAGGDRPA